MAAAILVAVNSGLTNTGTWDARGGRFRIADGLWVGRQLRRLFATCRWWRYLITSPAITGAIASVATELNHSGVVYAAAFNNLAQWPRSGRAPTSTGPDRPFHHRCALTPTHRSGNQRLVRPDRRTYAFKSTDGGHQFNHDVRPHAGQVIWTTALGPANSQVVYAGTNQDNWKIPTQYLWQQIGITGHSSGVVRFFRCR